MSTYLLLYQKPDCSFTYEGPFTEEELVKRNNELKDTCGTMAVSTSRLFDIEKFAAVREVYNEMSEAC